MSELVEALWLIGIISQRPTQHLDPVLHELRCPVRAVELASVAEHSDDVIRVFLLVPDKLESDAPEHGDADEGDARGSVYGVQVDIVGVLGIKVYGVICVTAGPVGGVTVRVVDASWRRRNGRTLGQTGVQRRDQRSSSLL